MSPELPPHPRATGACPRCGASPRGRERAHFAEHHQAQVLLATLEAVVPLQQLDLGRLPWRVVERVAHESAGVVGSHGDDLQFGGRHCARAFAALARGLAAVSFSPGGVTFLGAHWCAAHPDAERANAAPHGQYAGAPT